MADDISYESCVSEWISGVVHEKRSLGYKYYNEAKWMRHFDRYWIEHGYGKEGLTLENITEWMKKRDGEGNKCQSTRISVIRQYAIYLIGLGIESYFPPLDIRYPKAVIHLPTEEEISSLFAEIDAYSPRKGSSDTWRVANEYPVLFRLIYLNGLRAGEACQVSMENVDLDAGVILIADGKGNRDRNIHLSEDMAELCREYHSYLREKLGHEPKWLFPGIKPEKPLSYGSVSVMFRMCWLNTDYAGHCDRNPTTHCLRHAYVVKRINLWREQGMDFEHMLPYLSKFLGHRSFDESYYYYHFTEESARTIREKDTVINRVIPEVMRR